jgi:hypothetical protein
VPVVTSVDITSLRGADRSEAALDCARRDEVFTGTTR